MFILEGILFGGSANRKPPVLGPPEGLIFSDRPAELRLVCQESSRLDSSAGALSFLEFWLSQLSVGFLDSVKHQKARVFSSPTDPVATPRRVCRSPTDPLAP